MRILHRIAARNPAPTAFVGPTTVRGSNHTSDRPPFEAKVSTTTLGSRIRTAVAPERTPQGHRHGLGSMPCDKVRRPPRAQGQSAAITPPQTRRFPRYKAPTCPGATAFSGAVKLTRAESPASSTRASTGFLLYLVWISAPKESPGGSASQLSSSSRQPRE